MKIKIATLDSSGNIENTSMLFASEFVQGMHFIGEKSKLTIGDKYDQAKAWEGEFPPGVSLSIKFDAIEGDAVQQGFDNEPNETTLKQGLSFTSKSPLAIPDRKFRVPFKRIDTGRVIYMMAEVKNGVATISGAFPTSGKWQLDSELLNSGFKRPLFDMKTHFFMVI